MVTRIQMSQTFSDKSVKQVNHYWAGKYKVMEDIADKHKDEDNLFNYKNGQFMNPIFAITTVWVWIALLLTI